MKDTDYAEINPLYELNKSKNADDLIQHHRYVVEYHREFNNNRETNFLFVQGYQTSPDEAKKYRDKRKTPVVFNQIKTSERTILGLWLQNRYDVEFSANSPVDDDIGEVLQQLDNWEQNEQGDDMNDIELMRQAWAGGNSFQECYMAVVEGREPTMYSTNQNPFAVYWDPDSRQLITRRDAWFVDRDTWMNYPTIKQKFKDKIELIEERLESLNAGDDGYEEVPVATDRGHESVKQRNGEYKVTERFYKVPGVLYFAEVDNMRIDVDEEDVKRFKKEMPGVPLQSEDVDELWLAIVCEDISNQEYLFNGKYHCQPRDPRTKDIVWPILEMVAESLNGQPQSFVDHERDANRIVNQMMANILSSATHSAASSMLIDPTAFISEDEAKLAARHHSDSDRAFQVKTGRTKDAMQSIEKGGTNTDHQYALDYALTFLKDITSTPPAMQGKEESSGVSGVLNAQRIEQGFTQLQPLMKNFRLFLKQRAILRYYYWRTYYNGEKTFRIMDRSEPNMNPFVTINELAPEMDATGEWTGGIKKLKDINAAIYGITIKESVKSPMYRDKQLQFIERLMNSVFVKSDAGLAGALLEESLRLSDAPEKTKETLKKYSNLIQQAEQAKRAAEQQLSQTQAQGAELDNMSKMQSIAQAEAEQTGISPNAAPQRTGTPEPAMAMSGGGY